MKRKQFAYLLCTVCFMLILVKPGDCAEKPSCAVLMFSSDEALSEKISSRYVTNRFAETLGLTGLYDVLDQGEMIKKLSQKTNETKIEKCADLGCAVAQGRLLETDYVIYGVFGHIGNLYSLETSLVDVKNGSVIQTAVTDFEGDQDEFAEKVPPENLKSLLGVSELPVLAAAPSEKLPEAEAVEEEQPASKEKKFHIGPIIGVGASDDEVEVAGGFEVCYSHLFFKALGNDDGIAGGFGYYLHAEGNSPYLAIGGAYYEVDRHGGEEDGIVVGILLGYRLHVIDRLNLNVGIGIGYDDWDWDRDKKKEGLKNEDDDEEIIPIGELTLSYMF